MVILTEICACFFASSLMMGGGDGAGYTFFGGGEGGRVHSAQGTTQFVDHKLTRIIQKELQSLIKYFVRS